MPKTVIPFNFRGHKGEVVIYYRKNDKPREINWNIPRIEKNAILLLRKALGFPVINAKVSYEGKGYDTMFGWIQFVTTEKLDTGEKQTEFDPFGSTSDLNLPFAPFGFLPDMFDAPITWKNRHNFKWTADTFLANFPLRRNQPIHRVLGFRWGYIFRDNPVKPDLLPLTTISGEEWKEHLPLLKRRFKGWKFSTDL